MIAPVAGDPRFFRRQGPFSLTRVAEAMGFSPEDLPTDETFTGVAPLQTAGPTEVSFLTNRRYMAALVSTRAGAVIVDETVARQVPATAVALVATSPYAAWARVAGLFHPREAASPGIHPSAVIDPTAVIDDTAEVGALAVIGADVRIGARSSIGPLVSIGAGVEIGDDTRIGANCSISHSLIGNRVFVFPGARLGQEGFGFEVTPQGFITVPQLGRVIIEDDVEIGSNSMVDRGSSQDTVIGAGSRLDNSVQIAHNVRLGRGCVIVAQVGISGSTILDDHVTVAGQAGFSGHLHIGRGAKIGAQAGVMADVPARAEVVGSPAEPVREFFRQVAYLRRLMRRDDAAKHHPSVD